MNSLLIPFGLDRATGDIIEPEDADKGRACNCICPGCHAPLLSRHPKEKRIHFAHDSKHPDAKPDEECPFSSAVAVAMMVRELAGRFSGKSFFIPEYSVRHRFKCCGDLREIVITNKKSLKINSAIKKPNCVGRTFDLELGLGEAKIFVDLFYKGKPEQYISKGEVFAEEKSGILAINCDTFDLGSYVKDKRLRFSEAVLVFLLEAGFRKWIFHPRQSTSLEKEITSHQCRASNNPWEEPVSNDQGDMLLNEVVEYLENTQTHTIESIVSFKPRQYRCVICNIVWLQEKPGAPICPKCETHMYSVKI